ncbi:hypothetical protein [Streptomyces sp. OspMP-M43]|uniref:hypothetical protein n=1 Tax=Streptomyces sp. OspMP-M43 TaxID=1839781 RepID=UPI00081BBE7A|nr:hypothetical protein [Streptomyces sp. OspMP-M43]SCE62564.1 hypothetical protein GA0115261_113541 [Streptomyces sp. OspMP-M43]
MSEADFVVNPDDHCMFFDANEPQPPSSEKYGHSRPVQYGALTVACGDTQPDGFLLMAQGYSKMPNGWCMTWVKSTDPAMDMVKPQESWQQLGNSSWRPVAPPGYRACSDAIGGMAAPPRTSIACIKDSDVDGFRYVHLATPTAEPILGTSFWANRAPKYATGANGVRVAPSMGLAHVYSGEQPEGAPTQYVLNLPVNRRQGPNPSKPEMKNYDEPIALTEYAEDNRITVPFMSVYDQSHTVQWQMANSPTYTLRRRCAYRLITYLNNETSIEQSKGKDVTEGISKSQTDTFRVSVGYSISAEAGVSFLGTGGKVSSTTSIELGYEHQWNVTTMVSETHREELKVAPKHAGALYGIAHELAVHREDGTVAGTGEKLGFDARRAYLVLQYPPAVQGEPPAAVTDNGETSTPTS